MRNVPYFDNPENHAQIPSAVVSVIEAIEVDIIRARILPGAWLIEDHLMDDYAAKRHVVRSALTELNRLGVVVKQPHHGARVRRFDQPTLLKLCHFRDVLHTTAIDSFVFPIAPERIDLIHHAAVAHAESATSGDLIKIHRSNMIFHRLFYGLCDNLYVAESIRLHDWISFPARAYGMSNKKSLKVACDEHAKMVEAIRAEDRPLLRVLVCKHSINARQLYERKFLLNAN